MNYFDDKTKYKYCWICTNKLSRSRRFFDNTFDFMNCICPRCGNYNLEISAYRRILSIKNDLTDNSRLIVSNNIFHNYQAPFIINDTFLNLLFALKDKSPLVKLDSLLLSLYKHSSFMHNNTLKQNDILLIEAESWLCGTEEYNFALDLLIDNEYITFQDGGVVSDSNYTITNDGYKHIDKLLKEISQSQQGFVAMSLNQELDYFFQNGVIAAITEIGFDPRRIDKKEHINKIDDEIIVEIRNSRFMVADLTFHRPNVYYEFGYAHALGIPVFFTCREDQKSEMHFDIQQYNCLFWNNDQLDNFKNSLINRMKAVLNV
jgi:hypothetical protein